MLIAAGGVVGKPGRKLQQEILQSGDGEQRWNAVDENFKDGFQSQSVFLEYTGSLAKS
jgi:hypothetical protein